MKRYYYVFLSLLLFSALFHSCARITDFDYQVEDEQGLLSLKLGSYAGFNTTRAVSESAYKNTDNYTVVVLDKDGKEKLHCKGAEISTKMPIVLSMGSYSVKAFYGEEHDASRDEFYVYGEVEGNIKAGKEEQIEVVCAPTCGRIVVNFDSNMNSFFSDYHVSFKGTEALGTKSIEWLKGDTAPWYVKLKEVGEEITYTITTTAKDEYVNANQQPVAITTGTFVLKRNEGYKMNLSANYVPTDVGNGKIVITIDDGTNDIPVDIEVPLDWI